MSCPAAWRNTAKRRSWPGKKAKLLEYNVTGRISDADFLSLTAGCNREVEEAEAAIQELEEQLESSADYKKHIEDIRRTLKAAQGLIGKEFVEQYIDRIYVTPEADGALRLDVKIFTGESTACSLEKLKHRTGHTFKMKLHGDTTADLVSDIGISPQRFSAKLNEYQGAEFNQGEILKIRERYSLTDEEAVLFFCTKQS